MIFYCEVEDLQLVTDALLREFQEQTAMLLTVAREGGSVERGTKAYRELLRNIQADIQENSLEGAALVCEIGIMGLRTGLIDILSVSPWRDLLKKQNDEDEYQS